MVFGRDFFWVVLQFGAWMRGPGFKIGLFGNCHAANGVSPEVFPDQFVWIAVGQECATTYGPINNAPYRDRNGRHRHWPEQVGRSAPRGQNTRRRAID
jgi:hypothetical protein